jgi:AraC-like DNA-binding protein
MFAMKTSLDPYPEMASIIARFASADGELETAIDGFFIGRRSAPSPALNTTQWPCFALVVQGAKSLRLGTEVFEYGVGDCLVVSLDLPVVSFITQASIEVPHLGVAMAIDGERLKHLIGRIGMPTSAGAADAMRGVAVNGAAPELLDATLRMLRLLDRPHDIPAMAPLIEEEILYRLLTSPYGPRLLRIAQAESPGNRISKAIAWLRQNFTSALRVEDLARHVGMSVSSLHHHFSAVTAMTPMQYQKKLRLYEARRLMLVERLDVGTAGYRVGYQSPSQFSREYSRLFGRSPLRDVENLRDSLVVNLPHRDTDSIAPHPYPGVGAERP